MNIIGRSCDGARSDMQRCRFASSAENQTRIQPPIAAK